MKKCALKILCTAIAAGMAFSACSKEQSETSETGETSAAGETVQGEATTAEAAAVPEKITAIYG